MGQSPGGAAFKAAGTGIIQSTASSYVFVPGNALIKNLNTDTTRWDVHSNGGASIWRGAGAGNKLIYLPITLPPVLYGQAVTVESITVYYRCQNGANNFITDTSLNKQTDADIAVSLVSDVTDRASNIAASYTLVPAANNVLSAAQGGLGFFLHINFVNDTEYVKIGGVRIQLSHQ